MAVSALRRWSKRPTMRSPAVSQGQFYRRYPSKSAVRRCFTTEELPGQKRPVFKILKLRQTTVTDFTHDGLGFAHVNGKPHQIFGGMIGEEVEVVVEKRGKRKRSLPRATVMRVVNPSEHRTQPVCKHFGDCGSCTSQHIMAEHHLQLKDKLLLRQLDRSASVQPKLLPPLVHRNDNGELVSVGYRRRGRLSVRCTPNDKVFIGFQRQRGGVTDTEECPVLHPRVGSSQALAALRDLILSLDCRHQLPTIEFVSKHAQGSRVDAGLQLVSDTATGFLFRHLVPLSPKDSQHLIAFGDQHDALVYTQSGGPQTVAPLGHKTTQAGARPFRDYLGPWPDLKRLNERVGDPENATPVAMNLDITGFTQVNSAVNQRLVQHVLEAVFDQQPPPRLVLDLFCGAGNFSVPLACCDPELRVFGIEGSKESVNSAEQNARRNGCARHTKFLAADLAQEKEWLPETQSWMIEQSRALATSGSTDRQQELGLTVVCDPPRSGCWEVVQSRLLHALSVFRVTRIVYVSCSTSTLARDAAHLCGSLGFDMVSTRCVDLFPQTGHIESLSVFTRSLKAD